MLRLVEQSLNTVSSDPKLMELVVLVVDTTHPTQFGVGVLKQSKNHVTT